MNRILGSTDLAEVPTLIDGFGRRITYLRLSVTDRCDFRCVYCMAEEMTFLPRAQVLTLEELALVGEVFAELGVKSIRVTGGEPLVRRDVLSLMQRLGTLGLNDLTITTNGAKLAGLARPLVAAGVTRVNISLDTLDDRLFTALTRHGRLGDVLAGIAAAKAAGFERIRLNAVILRDRNLAAVRPLVQFALDEGLDIAFIEEMPLGAVVTHDRTQQFVPSAELREHLAEVFELSAIAATTPGPARYHQVAGYSSRIGFISPHSNNFCASCNRVRVSAEGRLLLCLGNEHSADLRSVIRRYPGETGPLRDTIVNALTHKPERHYFEDAAAPQIVRFMNSTGG